MKYTCRAKFHRAATTPYCQESKWNGKIRIALLSIPFDIEFDSGLKVSGCVPQGFLTDLGSVPDIAKSLVDDNDESILGFIIHDFVVKKDCPIKLTRKQCDELLYDVIRSSGQSWWRSVKTWLGVKIGDITIDYHTEPVIIDLDYVNMIYKEIKSDLEVNSVY